MTFQLAQKDSDSQIRFSFYSIQLSHLFRELFLKKCSTNALNLGRFYSSSAQVIFHDLFILCSN